MDDDTATEAAFEFVLKTLAQRRDSAGNDYTRAAVNDAAHESLLDAMDAHAGRYDTCKEEVISLDPCP